MVLERAIDKLANKQLANNKSFDFSKVITAIDESRSEIVHASHADRSQEQRGVFVWGGMCPL